MAKEFVISSLSFRDQFKKVIESSNINLLLGAGFSYGIADTLGNTEKILEGIGLFGKNNKYAVLEAYMFWDFFIRTIYPLCDKVNHDNVKEHIRFMQIWQDILRKRESAVLNKQINVFTTNYDIVLEYALESVFIDYNDGFKGRIMPSFSTAYFNRLYFERAIFSNKSAEIPIFNVLKLHGSVTWKIKIEQGQGKIVYSEYLKDINAFYEKHKLYFEVENKEKIEDIEVEVSLVDTEELITEEVLDRLLPDGSDEMIEESTEFVSDFKRAFKIVNPTKQKFNDTLIDKNYYELMRIYSNELEKNNTVLIVEGFSFEDEHIQEITKRALGNPSLIIVIFAFNKLDVSKYRAKFERYHNVWIVTTPEPTEDQRNAGVEEIYLDLYYLNNQLDLLFGAIYDT